MFSPVNSKYLEVGMLVISWKTLKGKLGLLHSVLLFALPNAEVNRPYAYNVLTGMAQDRPVSSDHRSQAGLDMISIWMEDCHGDPGTLERGRQF